MLAIASSALAAASSVFAIDFLSSFFNPPVLGLKIIQESKNLNNSHAARGMPPSCALCPTSIMQNSWVP